MFNLMPTKGRDEKMARSEDLFEQIFDNFFTNTFPQLGNMRDAFHSFNVDVVEEDEAYLVKADLPGFKKDEIQITYDSNYLTIEAKSETELEEKEENFIRRERKCGTFKRSFYVEDIDEDDIDASFEDGLLQVKLKKQDPVSGKSSKSQSNRRSSHV